MVDECAPVSWKSPQQLRWQLEAVQAVSSNGSFQNSVDFVDIDQDRNKMRKSWKSKTQASSVGGKGIIEGITSTVVGLRAVPDSAGDGGEEDEKVNILPEDLMQAPGALDLRRRGRAPFGSRHVVQGSISQDHGTLVDAGSGPALLRMLDLPPGELRQQMSVAADADTSPDRDSKSLRLAPKLQSHDAICSPKAPSPLDIT
ncbi:hypothetical protein AKAW_11086 [Aspergillus luchuensis IFO 4308]|nr:hypothetical protein AKAW_11086 [Aspergillus luchuensis IFO 4308]